MIRTAGAFMLAGLAAAALSTRPLHPHAFSTLGPGGVALATFDIGATPNPVGDNFTTTLSAAVGSPDTSLILKGLQFGESSQPQLVLPGSTVALPVNSYTTGRIHTTIPASYLSSPGTVTLQVSSGQNTGGPIQPQVYAPYTVTPNVLATPSSFTYGSAALSRVSTPGSFYAATPAAFTEQSYSGGTEKLVTADLNGDGYLDFALSGETNNGNENVVEPWYYGNDAQATLTGSAAPIGPAQTGITAAATSLTLSSSTTSTTAGTVVRFKAQLAGAAIPSGEPVTLTGLPTTATVAPAMNASGIATYSFGLFAPGNYTIQATYAGDANLTAAASNTISLQVSPTPVSVSIASSANPVTYPAAINLTATATSRGLGVPDGSVEFDNNASAIGTNSVTTVNGSSGLASAGTLAANGQQDIAVVTGDFNHDGNLDVAALQYDAATSTTTLVVALGNGNGTFQSPVVYGESAGVDPSSVVMAAADFNGDGYTDLVIVASDGAVTTMLAKGDAAGDLVLGQQLYMPNGASARRARSLKSPARALQSPLTGEYSVAAGDFNHDGQPDFAVAYASTVEVYFDNGGTFPAGGSWSATYESSNFTGMAAADFDQNGYADLALSDEGGPDVMVLQYDPEIAGFDSQTWPVGASAGAVAAGDLNGDGYADLAVTSYSDSTVAVLLNNGSGGFAAPALYGVAVQPSSVTIADFNQDGYGDIAVAGAAAGEGGGTSILLGSPSGAMNRETSLAGAPGTALAAADLNGDGNPDLLVGNSGVGVYLDRDAAASLTGVVLPAGKLPLTAAYSGSDSGLFASATSAVLNETVRQAASVLSWAAPAPIVYGTALGDAQLDATATPPGGTFTYSPAAGTILPVGKSQLSVTYAPADAADYLPATASVQIVVTPNLTFTAVAPATGLVGSAATTVTLSGAGFTPDCIVALNGETVSSSYMSATEMTAVLPASFFAEAGTGVITVTNPDANYTTPGVNFVVKAAQVQVHLSGPSSASPGEQPSLTFNLLQPFPEDLEGTFTLTVTPATDGGPVDPAVQFSTGGDTLTFTIPANTTATPTVQIQTGTLAATITVTLTLQANGEDVTPETLQPVVIGVPATSPVISSVSLARSGKTLTVTVNGFSSTRDMSTAEFAFTPAAGAAIGNPRVAVDVSAAFAAWYSQSASDAYGSAFSYTQTFQLSNDASTIGSVSVTLTNSVGKSKTVSGQ